MAHATMVAAGAPRVAVPASSDAGLASVSQAPFASFAGLRRSPLAAHTPLSRSAAAAPARGPLSVRAATTVAPAFTTLKPLADRVLVKIQQAEEKTQGGILLPTTAQSKPQGGKVVAVGPGRTLGDKTISVDVEVGSEVVYSKYAGTELDFAGTPHVLVKEDDIVGVLNTDDIKDLKPLNDRVLIKILETEAKTAGGVLLTESAKEKPVVGQVVAVGPGPLGEDGARKALEVTTGSTVLYSKFAGNEFKSKDGTAFVVLRSSDVMAILS